ncbi:xylanase [Vibrio kyushuensis]|uniref:glycoside hydrolase n=1 Tax=Vibrio TaxID=662 RepID=UPI003D0A5EDD
MLTNFKLKPITAALVGSLLLAGCSGASNDSAANRVVSDNASQLAVDTSTTYQTMHSFGASDAWTINPLINHWIENGQEEHVEQLAELLFSTENGIGLSAWRVNIGAGSAEQGRSSQISDTFRRAELLMAEPNGEIDTSKQLGQIRMMQEAQALGVDEFVAFINSPPHWATKNGLTYPANFTDFGGVGSTNLDPEQEENFVNFMVSVLDYLQKEAGVPVNHISPINEPTWDWEGGTPQEANRYNMDELKSLYFKLDDALKQANLSTPVAVDGAEVVEYTAALSDEYKIQFDHGAYTGAMNSRNQGLYKNYIDELLGDEQMRDVLHNKISVHGYWSDHVPERMGDLRDLLRQNVDSVSPGAEIWMSEICILGGEGDVRSFGGHGYEADDMDLAIHVAKVMHRDLTRLNASAWHWWLAVTPYNYKDGLLKIDSSLDADTLEETKLFWTVGNYSRFIRPGFERVSLDGHDDLNGLMASSYYSEEEGQLVTVVVNASSTQAMPLELNTAKIELADSEVYVTNKNHNLENVGQFEQGYVIEPMTTVTIVSAVK